ncbi:MAG TPA: bifunctional phosphoribosyl-AMP cyclohydrolase/phosphoribosyl-ATP diphosphatase HisIE [Longimicrobiales bacterium]|jgi:phosphoribosyl-ATP pyrophosphohydrolase/phosphoribosyl-AMP cyclohydrolase
MTNRTLRDAADLDALAFAPGGDGVALMPVVAQDARTGQVLMVAWADREALERSLGTREMHFWSRTRAALWRKGETSGNFLRVRSLHADCDGDTVLALVDPTGPACHTGETTCFGAGTAPHATEADATYHGPGGAGETGAIPEEASHPQGKEDVLNELWDVIHSRARDMPEGSYTTLLLSDTNVRLKKLGEETAELILAVARGEPDEVTREGADLIYHVLVALQASGSSLDEVRLELARRRK